MSVQAAPPRPAPPVTYYVPGKVMLAGEYAVLFGGQALTATLSCGVLVTCTRSTLAQSPATAACRPPSASASPRRPFITITSSLWQRPRHLQFHELTQAESRGHQELITHTLGQFITHARSHHPSLWKHIYAIATCSEYPSATSFHLDVNSELPPAAGIGSSSAITLGVLLAFNRSTGQHLDDPEILQLACRSQQMYQRGYGSGYDVISQYYGGIVLTQGPTEGGRIATMVRHHHEAAFMERATQLLSLYTQPQLTTSTSALLATMLAPVESGSATRPPRDVAHPPTLTSPPSMASLPAQPPAEFATICTWQRRLVALLSAFKMSAELIATARTAHQHLCQHPQFTYPQELFAELCTVPGFNQNYTVKTTGAGGSDALLSIGTLPAQAVTILSSYGYKPLANSLSSRGAHRQP